ncbi:hypothetical protein ABIF64_000442 [Bradyrhizobium japonicum]|uniref:hypothetical protein n=1 Tax=Bradyrhizobium japonicum TaxID=375 RepID=UPI003398B434
MAVTVITAKGFNMVELAKKFFGWTTVRLVDKPLPEPEPVNANARPMTGFFAGLTPEQKKKALEYRGEEAHGDKTFLHA